MAKPKPFVVLSQYAMKKRPTQTHKVRRPVDTGAIPCSCPGYYFGLRKGITQCDHISRWLTVDQFTAPSGIKQASVLREQLVIEGKLTEFTGEQLMLLDRIVNGLLMQGGRISTLAPVEPTIRTILLED